MSESDYLTFSECNEIQNHQDWRTDFENSKKIFQLLEKDCPSEKRWTHPWESDRYVEIKGKWILTERDPYKKMTIPAYSFTELLVVYNALAHTIMHNDNIQDAQGWLLRNYCFLFDSFVDGRNINKKLESILDTICEIQKTKKIFNPRQIS